jgi:hypothetical protein
MGAAMEARRAEEPTLIEAIVIDGGGWVEVEEGWETNEGR